MSQRVERGDWQTPLELARTVVEGAVAHPLSIVEPTCGQGAFLEAAAELHPQAELHGWELNPRYVREAARRVPSAHVHRANFFTVDWKRALAKLPEPLLVVGNPPWVTNAVARKNLPTKSNFKRLKGLDALTGKANFDVSEWMILTLLEALRGRAFTLSMLCKTSVARKVAERHGPTSLRTIDAARHFDAAVDAVVFTCDDRPRQQWRSDRSMMGLVDGVVVKDLGVVRRTRHFEGSADPAWRSGLKHDCSDVMELTSEGVNGLGQRVAIENDLVFPLLKSSDVANDRPTSRQVIVTQTSLGDDPSRLETSSPRAWAYLKKHSRALAARRSSIYRGRPPFLDLRQWGTTRSLRGRWRSRASTNASRFDSSARSTADPCCSTTPATSCRSMMRARRASRSRR